MNRGLLFSGYRHRLLGNGKFDLIKKSFSIKFPVRAIHSEMSESDAVEEALRQHEIQEKEQSRLQALKREEQKIQQLQKEEKIEQERKKRKLENDQKEKENRHLMKAYAQAMFDSIVNSIENNQKAQQGILDDIKRTGSTTITLYETDWNGGCGHTMQGFSSNENLKKLRSENNYPHWHIGETDAVKGFRQLNLDHEVQCEVFKGWRIQAKIEWYLAFVFILIIPTRSVKITISQASWKNLWHMF